LYFNREKRINEKWAWNAGIRLPLWKNMGPAYTFAFDENYLPTDTLVFQDRDVIQRYLVPELRLSARYRLTEQSSVRISWGNYQQNLHLLSNSISPFSSFEIWMPSSKNIKPQRANQFTAGISGIIQKQGMEWSADAYVKNMDNQIEYAEHANLMLNPLIEGELRFGKSQSYGVELSVRKNMGRFTGWAGYTWSRVFNQFDGINQNKKYPAFYDRPHDVSIYLSWEASKRIILSANWIYFTGSAITTPIGFYQQGGAVVPYYGEKNNDRLPNYHRLDFSLSWIFGKPSYRFQHSLNFGIFNLYNRTNPISINFNKIKEPDGQFVVPINQYNHQEIITTQKYLSSFMPSVTYKFNIK
jgi:outer membrane receptor protein involved in Fe transport